MVSLALLYVILPVTFERNWLGFFDPVRNGYLPYVDFHVGYPPIGFLTYMPFALLSNSNLTAFAAFMRTINALFLILSIWLVYIIVYKIRGRRDALISAIVIMASFTTLSYNRHSNESIALFFALLGIYYLTQLKTFSAGFAIGLGAMTKITPGLLILPALKKLESAKQRVLLIGGTGLLILFLNLPFVILNPFMWWGTYVYNGARGPWETIWALAEGWYSHGGGEVLHPYFEAFIPYPQLTILYKPAAYDHAYYAWNNPWLPTLLTVLTAASVLVSYFVINKRDILEGTALITILFIFFSKGYSPGFTIFVLPFIALGLEGNRKIISCAMLEIATILQSTVWLPGFYSQTVLATAAILRAITFASVIAILLMHFIKKPEAIKLPSLRLSALKTKFAVIFTISILFAILSAYYLQNYYRQFPLTIETRTGATNTMLYQTISVPVPNLTKNDRVMFNFTSSSPTAVSVMSNTETIWTTKTPKYNVRDLFVYRNTETEYYLAVNMAYPSSNFTIVDGTNGDGKGTIEPLDGALNITLTDFGKDSSQSILKLSWQMEKFTITDGFRAKATVRNFSGHVNQTLLSLNLADSEGEYEYVLPQSDAWKEFEVNSSSVTLEGLPFSRIKGREAKAVSIVLIVEDGNQVSIGMKELTVWNEGKNMSLDLRTETTSQTSYQIYIAHAYSPTNEPAVYIAFSLFVAGALTAWLSLLKVVDKGEGLSKLQ